MKKILSITLSLLGALILTTNLSSCGEQAQLDKAIAKYNAWDFNKYYIYGVASDVNVYESGDLTYVSMKMTHESRDDLCSMHCSTFQGAYLSGIFFLILVKEN